MSKEWAGAYSRSWSLVDNLGQPLQHAITVTEAGVFRFQQSQPLAELFHLTFKNLHLLLLAVSILFLGNSILCC